MQGGVYFGLSLDIQVCAHKKGGADTCVEHAKATCKTTGLNKPAHRARNPQIRNNRKFGLSEKSRRLHGSLQRSRRLPEQSAAAGRTNLDRPVTDPAPNIEINVVAIRRAHVASLAPETHSAAPPMPFTVTHHHPLLPPW